MTDFTGKYILRQGTQRFIMKVIKRLDYRNGNGIYHVKTVWKEIPDDAVFGGNEESHICNIMNNLQGPGKIKDKILTKDEVRIEML